MVGIDIVDIARIGGVLERHGERFLEKVFSASEIARAHGTKRLQEYLAGRFAGEAFMKASGERLLAGSVLSEKAGLSSYTGKRYDGQHLHERSYAVSS